MDVDIFNINGGIWSTAVLWKARNDLSATSLPKQGIALFAGGIGQLLCLCPRRCFSLFDRLADANLCLFDYSCAVFEVSCLLTHLQLAAQLWQMWTSSMQTLDVGVLQLSAKRAAFLQPRRCPIKD